MLLDDGTVTVNASPANGDCVLVSISTSGGSVKLSLYLEEVEMAELIKLLQVELRKLRKSVA